MRSRVLLGICAAVTLVLAACTGGGLDGNESLDLADAVEGSSTSTTADASPRAASSPQQPTYGSVVIDGTTSGWNLSGDFFANMYQAGKPDKPVLSTLYVRYACDTQTLYTLVLTEPGWEIIPSDDDNFVKLGNNDKLVDGSAGNDGTPPDFEYFADLTGWEASAPLAPGQYDNLNVHAQVKEAGRDGGDGETSAVADRAIPILIVCGSTTTTSTTMPTTTTSTTMPTTTTTLPVTTTTLPVTTTTLPVTTTTMPVTTTLPATTTTLPVTTTTVPDTTTTVPSTSTSQSGGGGSSTTMDSTTTSMISGSSIAPTLPHTGPDGPFGSLTLVVWAALSLMAIGALVVRTVTDRS